jgi:Tol biopolymer transport system component
LERGTISRFTDKEYDAYWGIWSPDGKQIVFNSNLRGGEKVNLYMKNSDGSGPTVRLTTKNYHQMPKCWSADGKVLIYTEWTHSDTTKGSDQAETGMDVWMLPIDGRSPPKPFLNTQFNEINPALSPDGQWLAYASDEPGEYEVFVCSFPGHENKMRVSTGGGTEPVWAPDGKELYYRNITGSKLFVVPINEFPKLNFGKPMLLFQGNFAPDGFFGRSYDIAPDGKHFLMLEIEKVKPTDTRINIILNWFEELKKQLPAN